MRYGSIRVRVLSCFDFILLVLYNSFSQGEKRWNERRNELDVLFQFHFHFQLYSTIFGT